METRKISGRLVTRQPAADKVTGAAYYRYSVCDRVAVSATLQKDRHSGHDREVPDAWEWQETQAWDKGPGERFQAHSMGLTLLHALPRTPTPAETEIRRAREAGFTLAAAQLEASHPPAPAVVIEPLGSLFAVNEEELMVGKQGHALLALGSDEIRDWIRRHTLGDGGTLGTFDKASVQWTEDAAFCPPLAGPRYESEAAIATGFGIVRSRFDAYRPNADGSDDQGGIDPRYVGTIHGRRRSKGDWVEVMTLITPNQPTRTIIFTNKDQILSHWR